MLTRHQIELIEIPQRMGAVRKNAADIKMAVDAVELCFERDYITTFVLGTGDSDFTPLVHKLRELNRRVIGVGIEASTSALLPPACDEFLFYERLEGVEPWTPARDAARRVARRRSRAKPAGRRRPSRSRRARAPTTPNLSVLVTQTLAGLERTNNGPVLASMLKRAMLRKDPTFNEADYGFRGFGELLRHLAETGVVELGDGSAKGDPEVSFPEHAARRGRVVRAVARRPSNASPVGSRAHRTSPGSRTSCARCSPTSARSASATAASSSSRRPRGREGSSRWTSTTRPTTTCSARRPSRRPISRRPMSRGDGPRSHEPDGPGERGRG